MKTMSVHGILVTLLIAIVWRACKTGCFYCLAAPDALSRTDFLMICDNNMGYGPSTFVSLTVGLNVAIAKWEPFSKSLTDVEGQFKAAMSSAVSKSEISSLLADDSSDASARLKELTQEPLNRIQKNNAALWKGARMWAVICAILGVAVLFGRLSSGLYGLALLAPTVITWVSARVSRWRVWKTVRSKIERIIEMEEADRRIAQQRMKSDVDSALGTDPTST